MVPVGRDLQPGAFVQQRGELTQCFGSDVQQVSAN
jgi:hypothetical protein